MNVIFVDWKEGANFPYHQAVGDTRVVGEYIHNSCIREFSIAL